MKFLLIWVVNVWGILYFVCALECGINAGEERKALKKITAECMSNLHEPEINGTEYPLYSPGGESSEETENAGNKNSRRHKRESADKDDKDMNDDSNSAVLENNKDGSHKCIVQCIFEKLEMTDSNGYPEHMKVSAGLLKSAEGRELRDFLRDSTDECFQMMNEGNKTDPCVFSSQLITCLADKGKSNCGDWPVGELPFTNLPSE